MGRHLLGQLRQTSGDLKVTLASATAIAFTAGILFAALLFFPGSGEGESVDLMIPRGASLAKVSEILSREQIISNPFLFKNIMRLTQGSTHVRAGEFRFHRGMRPLDALIVLYHDDPIVYRVVIPEGWTVKQIAGILADAKLVDPQRFTELALSKAEAEKHNIKAPHLEGYLFPDTYTFSKVDGEERIIETMVQHFLVKYQSEYKIQAEALGLTLNQFVTLASIVEKETGAPEERGLVSSVFHNRLKKRMKLQSDPTTIYGIPHFNGNLTRADLHRYSPYNTYVIPSLPPGPISNPGAAALEATLHPLKTNYLYFVSKNNGHHVFSETYSQHSRHVTTYQLHH